MDEPIGNLAFDHNKTSLASKYNMKSYLDKINIILMIKKGIECLKYSKRSRE